MYGVFAWKSRLEPNKYTLCCCYIHTHTRAIYPPTYTYFYVTTDITIRVQGVVCMILIFFYLPQTKQKSNFSTLFLLK